ncbi:MAG: SUMF1/EgtB/PvdO family nonheme iron enzyme [Candidatus Saganbacteria bacterium]|nr:SUMF1/EgtB/PvdO family nonheme iron enzyme [Candidatus Saganbacteria bacterium]
MLLTKIIAFDAQELLDDINFPSVRDALEGSNFADDLRRMGFPVAKPLIPHMNEKGILKKAAMSFFRRAPLILTPQEILSGYQTKRMPPIGTMVQIPGGEYTIGDNKVGVSAHQVTVDPFSIGVYCVTNREFQDVIEDGLYNRKELWSMDGWRIKESKQWRAPRFLEFLEKDERLVGDNKPVLGISWYEATAYLVQKSIQEGIDIKPFVEGEHLDLRKRFYDFGRQRWNWTGYRLPTEAEIEIAMRGGLDKAIYPWGNEAPDPTQANYAASGMLAQLMDVNPHWSGCPDPNGFGLFHAIGNNRVWGFDSFDEAYYKKGTRNNPAGPKRGSAKVIRGASWLDPVTKLRLALRGSVDPKIRLNYLGFRAVKSEII